MDKVKKLTDLLTKPNTSKILEKDKIDVSLLKKPVGEIFQIFAIIWMLFITWKYFAYHPEYFGGQGLTSSFTQSANVFSFLLLIGILYVFWVFVKIYQDKEKTSLNLTPFGAIGIFSVFLMLLGNFWFLAYKKEMFAEASLITANISLFSKLATTYIMFFIFALLSFAFGKKLLNFFKFETDTENKLGDSLLSIGLGLGIVMLVVFGLGFYGIITAPYIAITLILLATICYKEVVLFLNRFFLEKFSFETRFFSFEIFFLICLSLVLAMNMIDLVRPMPIGWDDMGVYLNYPKQMAGNQALLAGTTNNYFLLASLPFTFIRDEYLAAMNGMFVSFGGGVLMLLALIAFVRQFFGRQYGLLSACLIYTIPMTMHQSYADMKTDMTLFLFMILSIYSFLIWFQQEDLKIKKWLILSGIFAGIAFGIKPTAILLIFGVLIGVFYRIWGWRGALGIFLLEWIVLHFQHLIEITRTLSASSQNIFLGILAIGAMISFVFALIKHQKTKEVLLSTVIFCSFVGMSFAPWALKNLNENNYKIAIGAMLNGRDQKTPQLNLKALGVDASTCKNTAKTEEMGRYLGYEENLFVRYLTLPWKLTMNTTVHGFYLDLSFLFLSFVPLGVALYFIRKKGYAETQQKTLQVLMLMGGASWLMWMLIGSGIIWYGIFGFILIVPFTAYFFYENKTISLQIVTGFLVILSLFSVLALRGTKFANQATIQYAYGMKSGLEVVDLIVPNYRQIGCIVTGGDWNATAMECKAGKIADTSPIYRIGTFIAYFIPDNNHRLLADPQLDQFKCIDDYFGNNDLITMKKLKEAGFKYLILDLNTATIEKEPNGSLHQKANRFVEWVNNLNQDYKIYVHSYNKNKGIAFFEITDEAPIQTKIKEPATSSGSNITEKTQTGATSGTEVLSDENSQKIE